MSEGVNHNLDRLNRTLREYRVLSGKSTPDVLKKQGGKLAFALNRRLRTISPKKGSIRQERLAALKSGEGVKVRQSVRLAVMQKYGARSDIESRGVIFGKKGVKSVARKGGKRLNLYALMVQRELNLRERGRGFLAISAHYPRVLKNQDFAQSAYGPVQSTAGLTNNGDSLTFKWDGANNTMASDAAGGLNKAKGRAMIALALRDTTEDIRTYVNEKNRENLAKVGLK